MHRDTTIRTYTLYQPAHQYKITIKTAKALLYQSAPHKNFTKRGHSKEIKEAYQNKVR